MGEAKTVVVSDGALTAWIHRAQDSVTSPHCLPAARVIVPVDAVIQLSTPEGVFESRHCLIVAPNQPCVVGCEGTAITAFVDLKSPLARSCFEGREQLDAVLSDGLRSIVRCGIDQLENDAGPMLQAVVAALGGRRVSTVCDRRSEQALEWLESNPFEPWSMIRLARYTGVSTSHLAHLLKRDFGVSARTLALYHRARGAALQLSTGARTADVAQRAGFSDQAHLARALQRFFGKTSTYVRRGVSDRRDLLQ